MQQLFCYPFQVIEKAIDSQISWEELPTKLQDLIESGHEEVHVLGSGSWFSLVPFFSGTQKFKKPQLLVLSNETEMDLFAKSVRFFNPEAEIHKLSGFDVSPYSQLYPHQRIMCQRMNWLYRAQNATPNEIFLTTLHGTFTTNSPCGRPLGAYEAISVKR